MALSFEAWRRVLRYIGRLALLRVDLAAEELAIARRQWIGWCLAAIVAGALFTLALAALGAWLTLLLWERFGAATVGVLALVFAALGAIMLRGVMRATREAPPALARTRAALREDYDALVASATPERAGGPTP
jgi:uncharacterized membrane protein YqjE